MEIVNVSEITRYLKALLESDARLQDLWVTGEVSNLSRAPSGHLYFTLKDSNSQLSCVMWRSQAARLAVLPQNGARVIVHGYITIYEPRGAYQFYVDQIQAEGVGLLAAQFEQLKNRLAAEGLFDTAHKRPLPPMPQRIGLVTSLTGAVLHDIVTILRRRYPIARVVVAATAVQGSEAPAQIIEALAALQHQGRVDVIIVARGGGSLEDLWAFNDEAVARAIYACRVPVISAIGHEVDYTIADFVADVRAPTPSAAAELVAPDAAELAAQILARQRQLVVSMAKHLTDARTALAHEERTLSRLSPSSLLAQRRQRLDELQQRMLSAVSHDMTLYQERVRGLAVHLQALSPLAVLERGYAIVRKAGRVVARVAHVQPGDRIDVEVSDGRFGACVDGANRQERRAGRGQQSNDQLGLGL